VAAIVDGVTKLERIQFDSKEAQQAATMRKMLVAMAKDLRVLIIKLADRLHNMRTIAAMPSEKQRRIAQETLDIYAPLAHRLGIQELRSSSRTSRSPRCTRSATPSSTTWWPPAPPSARCTSPGDRRGAWPAQRGGHRGRGHRPRKHLWSIYEKMVVKGKEFDEIFDLVAVRVIVDS
jgi:guanosine-3',5'-bis(diphosphate) 3'-pyrophosphohydrolase